MGKIISRVRQRQSTEAANQIHEMQVQVHEQLAEIRREELMREANIASWSNLRADGRPTAGRACAPPQTEPPVA